MSYVKWVKLRTVRKILKSRFEFVSNLLLSNGFSLLWPTIGRYISPACQIHFMDLRIFWNELKQILKFVRCVRDSFIVNSNVKWKMAFIESSQMQKWDIILKLQPCCWNVLRYPFNFWILPIAALFLFQ